MKLTKKQEIFVQEYMRSDDASAAYRIAYSTSRMKATTVNRNAHELLKNNKIAARIAELQEVAAELAEKEFRVDSREILRQLNILRQARIDQYVNFVEIEKIVGMDEETREPIRISEQVLRFKPFDELTEEQLMCIESVKQNRFGEIELKLHGKEWTIEKINKHIGFYEKDHEQAKPKPEAPQDLSQLTLEELKTLQALQAKAKAQ